MPRPIPVADEVSKPFWDAVQERRLLIQTCTTCNRRQYPPEATCRQCGKADHLEWKETSGRGKVNGWFVQYDTRIVPLKAEQPFNTVVIELEEDPAILYFSFLRGVPLDEVPVGAPVEVIFEELSNGQLLHEWQLVK
jgi:uncharacterized OB-fold protein